MADEYVQVPVEAARMIANRYDKQVVVIVAEDTVHNKIHTTTYGALPEDKIRAAELGPSLAEAAGALLAESVCSEDFRTVDAAERAKEIEDKTRQLQDAYVQLTRLTSAIHTYARKPADLLQVAKTVEEWMKDRK